MSLIYRQLKKSDHRAVKELINVSFGLHSYVGSQSVLESLLEVYLQSCLSEQTFTRVAEKDGSVVGVIMGQAKCDYRALTHLAPILSMSLHTAAMVCKGLFHREKAGGEYKDMLGIYHELLAESGREFDGVLTLFAVSEQSQGLGVGKELLRLTAEYLRERGVKSIYLHTDSTCNYGFYDSQGFERLGDREMSMTRNGKLSPMGVYLYGYKIGAL